MVKTNAWNMPSTKGKEQSPQRSNGSREGGRGIQSPPLIIKHLNRVSSETFDNVLRS